MSRTRIDELKNGYDARGQIDSSTLHNATSLILTDDYRKLSEVDIYIVTVPTPVDDEKKPDFSCLRNACHMIGRVLESGNIVIFESTVFPGATEDLCVPWLSESSGLIFNKDFFVGYSPERINPGDKKNVLSSIVKITAGSTPEIAEEIDKLYAQIIKAGTFKASSIKVAEASKVFENIQRDVNIALVNELSDICNELGLRTADVLKAAETKWNFHRYHPGLVGGHCIGVDPYYLKYRAEQVGYSPQVLLSAREKNEAMPRAIANRLVLDLKRKQITLPAQCLIVGFSYKADSTDVRNSKVADLCSSLEDRGIDPEVVDPVADITEAKEVYNITIKRAPALDNYAAIIFCVDHAAIIEKGVKFWATFAGPDTVIYDLKSIFPPEFSSYSL